MADSPLALRGGAVSVPAAARCSRSRGERSVTSCAASRGSAMTVTRVTAR